MKINDFSGEFPQISADFVNFALYPEAALPLVSPLSRRGEACNKMLLAF